VKANNTHVQNKRLFLETDIKSMLLAVYTFKRSCYMTLTMISGVQWFPS